VFARLSASNSPASTVMARYSVFATSLPVRAAKSAPGAAGTAEPALCRHRGTGYSSDQGELNDSTAAAPQTSTALSSPSIVFERSRVI